MSSGPGPYEDDRSLVELAKQGNAAAFGEIYNRYLSVVYRYTSALLGDRTEAEDLTAETFLRALLAIEEYQWTGRPVSAWLLTIARNLIINHLRKKQRTRDAFRLLAVNISRGLAQVGGADDVELQDLRQAVLDLGPAERNVITLRFILGLDCLQVSQVLGKSVANVRVIQYRALRRLHQKLTSAGSTESRVA